MVQINLLPWRERARARKKKRFLILLLSAVFLSLFIVVLFNLKYHRIYKVQSSINQTLQNAINDEQSSLNAMKSQQEQMDALRLQLKLIANLYKKNYQAIDFFNKIISLIPSSITITKIKWDNNNVTFEGLATSENEVSNFIQKLAKSASFYDPVLSFIQEQKVGTNILSNFQVQVVQKGGSS